MKFKMILSTLLLSILLLSCLSNTKQKENISISENVETDSDVLTVDGKNYTLFNTTSSSPNESSTEKFDIQFYDVKDPSNGLTLTSIPLPGKWEQSTGIFKFIGPNKMKILGIRSGDFSYTDDPQKLNLFKTVGKKIQNPKTMDQIIQENFKTEAAKENRKLIKTYPLPEAAAFMEKFNSLQYKIDLTPMVFQAVGTEWQDPDGTSYLTIIIRHAEQGPTADSWGYTYDVIQSPKSSFEQAKRILINSIVNQEINMEWIKTVNRELKKKIDDSNIEHRKMMAEVHYNMEVFQKGQAQRRADREVLDNRISDYILGKSEVVNHQTGTTAKVEAGSTYYWINEKGEYISTESYSWDPNQHEPYKKHSTWKRHQLNH